MTNDALIAVIAFGIFAGLPIIAVVMAYIIEVRQRKHPPFYGDTWEGDR